MATQEKLLKSLEILKNQSAPNQTFDPSKKKDKLQHCHVVTEAITNSTIKIASNFHTYLSVTIEVLLQLCDDQESDVRMTAGDCLNRIIRALNDGKVQIELHKAIKRNGPARSLRAALKRFSQLAHLIRPHKGKAYVVNLFPTLLIISERPEEQIHETLANSLPEIMKVLGCFASDIEIKALLKGFLLNISNRSAVIRRSATSCILNVCLHCRKPQVFLAFVVNYLLDLVIPVSDSQDTQLILGVLLALKNVLAHLTGDLPLDKYLQIYELCIYYFSRNDHNVVNGALEVTVVLFDHCPATLKRALLSAKGIDKSRINLTSSFSTSSSQLSVATTNAVNEDLFVESELTDSIRPDIEKWIDESKLSVLNVSCDLEKSFSTESSKSSVDITLSQFDDSFDLKMYEKNPSICDNFERLTVSDASSEKSFSEEDKQHNNENFDISIGSFLDSDTSIVYCARLITKLFLLTGQTGSCISDKLVRVSVKSLALNCLASIVKLYPNVMLLYLDKYCNKSLPKNVSHQHMSDLFLFETHPDPQLRGILRVLVANFLSSLINQRDNFEKFMEDSHTNLDYLTQILIKGLQDESSNCSRQTIISLNSCLVQLAESSSNMYILDILNVLPTLADNPYWLVRVSLCELISKLPYVTIYEISGSGRFQSRVLNDILFRLLENEDSRIRSGAANAIATIIPYLYFEQFSVHEDPITSQAIFYRNKYLCTMMHNETSNLNVKHLLDNMPFPFSQFGQKCCDRINFSLSRILNRLYNCLLTATSNHFICGCIETLSLLSNRFPTTVYREAWNATLDLFTTCCYLLSNSTVVYDLNCHWNLLNVTSNLFAGFSLDLIKPLPDTEVSRKAWDIFGNLKLSKLTELYLSHIVKLLNILHYVVDDVVPSQLIQSKAVLSNLSTAASPIKRRKSDLMEKNKVLSPSKAPEEKKDASISSFMNAAHYIKLYDIIRQAYSNYKVTLEPESSGKFLNILHQVLHCFSVLMEVGTLNEFQSIAEEILGYFRFTFTLDACGTVECVQQLLKCLFGNNLMTNLDEIQLATSQNNQNSPGFYFNIYQKSYNDVSLLFKSLKNQHKSDGDETLMGYLHRKEIKVLQKSSDKILANYIRIFEPMVIKSLKHYTVTSDVSLQCKVLQLLNQLIQLRVNYCLLDSEQIFIGFVLKQFEFIEKGQILFADELIEKIFEFLVQLSYSKQHSKSIITIPKIIHLSDGLMASEQSPETHCIPALEPIVKSIFLTRNKSNTADMKELETTRDVVLSMLLRLNEHYQVLDLIVLILDDSKYCKNSEKWLRWSNQVFDSILPMLKQDKIKLDNGQALKSLRKLVFALEPSVLDSFDQIVLMLFQEPLIYEMQHLGFTRRLAKILIGLFILSPLKEDLLIEKLNELKGNFAPGSIFDNCAPTADPLNVLNSLDFFAGIAPEMIFLKFLFKVLTLSLRFCNEQERKNDEFLVEEIAVFLMYCIHIFQSGSHCKITIYAISNQHQLDFVEINQHFLKLSKSQPFLTVLWCYILTLLNYNSTTFWTQITTSAGSLSEKIVQKACLIVLCDFMNEDSFKLDQLSWFFKAHTHKIIHLFDEEPVSDFISSVHRDNSACKMFIDSVKIHDKNLDPEFVLKLLKSVENAHPCHTGKLLRILLHKLLSKCRELSVARLVANLASRKIELLLTMTLAEVNEQLTKEDVSEMIRTLVSLNLVKKHEALASLLNKLCTQCYDTSPLEFAQKPVNSQEIKQLKVDKSWFISQVKDKCKNKETVQLLNCLNYEELCELKETILGEFKFECVRLGRNETNPELVKAVAECLLKELEAFFQAEDFQDEKYLFSLFQAVPFLVSSLENSFVLIKFSVICLEFVNVVSKDKFRVNCVNKALLCTESILNNKNLIGLLNLQENVASFCSIVDHLYRIVDSLVKLQVSAKFNLDNEAPSQACYQMYVLVSWLYKCKDFPSKSIFNSIRNIIVALSRLSVVNSYALIPIQVWKSGWAPDMLGPFHTQVPPLPIDFLQEVDILEEFIFRITLLGWTSRQQFEETWMCFLSVLCHNFESKESLEIQEMSHASSLAVKAITALLVQTLYVPEPGNCNVSQLMHVSRNQPILGLDKLRKIQAKIRDKSQDCTYLSPIVNVFDDGNLEKRSSCYSYGLMSVKYLLKVWEQKEKCLKTNGLDINSCLQFLLDYYTQLLKNKATPLRFLHEIVRSTVILSDLFTDKSQFSWMLDIFLDLSKIHTVEDELLHQYLIVGISKAVATLTPDLEVYESLKKLLVQYLKSSFLPSRLASLHGLLYILEGCKLSNISIGGISDEMQIILPFATEYVQSNLNSNNEYLNYDDSLMFPRRILQHCQEHTVLVWTVAFFIVENVDEVHLEPDFVPAILHSTFGVLLQQNRATNDLQTILMKALERLVIFKKTIVKSYGKQIMNLALEKIKSENPNVSILGVQLLVTYMYTDCADQLSANDIQTNPDHLVQTIEKITAIFEHIKRGYTCEVEILCHILPDILNDFFSPADILTKVIGEFLSPQQPHPKLLSKVVFHVFERAIEEKQLGLLQDWVVFSLSSFTQSLSVGMATWCLTCFFISASTNQWLRLVFPYVQTRVGRYEYEDRRMLCIAGSDFYRNLTNEKQKQTFVENFRKIKEQPDTLFRDLLSSL